jgi:hypothetical protein
MRLDQAPGSHHLSLCGVHAAPLGEVSKITGNAVVLNDWTELEADLIV